jgi:hypothetical protein
MSQTVPFPPLPEWLPIASEDRPVALRAFGSDMRDLAVEFAGVTRPRLVTSLLACCSQTRGGGPPPEHAIWDLPLGTRIEAVVALAVGDSALPLVWRVRCRHAECGAEGELELRPAEITALAAQAHREKLVRLTIGARTAWLRRPTGADQRQWLDRGTDETAPMTASLFVDPALEDLRAAGIALDEIGDSIDRAMEEYDPLVAFHLDVGCPECGRSTAQAPDLLAGALERLWLAQFDLIEQVHRLASHYHWTEEEIAQVPFWRRQVYLARIDGGEL